MTVNELYKQMCEQITLHVDNFKEAIDKYPENLHPGLVRDLESEIQKTLDEYAKEACKLKFL